jgi:hypothetical protein
MKNECHEGNIEEENNGYVVFKCNILRLAQKLSGEGVSPPPHTFIQQAPKHMFKDDLYGFSRDYLTIQIQQCDYQSTMRAL